ncbi:hypothetical protein GQ55_9G443800 [Panicum hallii var. hallii]|uniref:Uncharacterized protein n=1 Tax=Panicum hallii var. hallii TaxID=1504633 RepID=A0A2T7CBG8_9POAL|nr:hypothetical protein GQ55_9G443800 [Panicum hallii var. hallii]
METHDWKGCLLLSFLLRQPAKNYFLPSPSLSLSLIILRSLPPPPSLPLFESCPPRRSRIPPLAFADPTAPSSQVFLPPCVRGPARHLRWVVGLPDGYRFLIHPDPGSAAKAAPFVGSPRHAGGFGASAVRRAGPLV